MADQAGLISPARKSPRAKMHTSPIPSFGITSAHLPLMKEKFGGANAMGSEESFSVKRMSLRLNKDQHSTRSPREFKPVRRFGINDLDFRAKRAVFQAPSDTLSICSDASSRYSRAFILRPNHTRLFCPKQQSTCVVACTDTMSNMIGDDSVSIHLKPLKYTKRGKSSPMTTVKSSSIPGSLENNHSQTAAAASGTGDMRNGNVSLLATDSPSSSDTSKNLSKAEQLKILKLKIARALKSASKDAADKSNQQNVSEISTPVVTKDSTISLTTAMTLPMPKRKARYPGNTSETSAPVMTKDSIYAAFVSSIKRRGRPSKSASATSAPTMKESSAVSETTAVVPPGRKRIVCSPSISATASSSDGAPPRKKRIGRPPKREISDLQLINSLPLKKRMGRPPKRDISDIQLASSLPLKKRMGRPPKRDISEVQLASSLPLKKRMGRPPKRDIPELQLSSSLPLKKRMGRPPKHDISELQLSSSLPLKKRMGRPPKRDILDLQLPSSVPLKKRVGRPPKRKVSEIQSANSLYPELFLSAINESHTSRTTPIVFCNKPQGNSFSKKEVIDSVSAKPGEITVDDDDDNSIIQIDDEVPLMFSSAVSSTPDCRDLRRSARKTFVTQNFTSSSEQNAADIDVRTFSKDNGATNDLDTSEASVELSSSERKGSDLKTSTDEEQLTKMATSESTRQWSSVSNCNSTNETATTEPPQAVSSMSSEMLSKVVAAEVPQSKITVNANLSNVLTESSSEKSAASDISKPVPYAVTSVSTEPSSVEHSELIHTGRTSGPLSQNAGPPEHSGINDTSFLSQLPSQGTGDIEPPCKPAIADKSCLSSEHVTTPSDVTNEAKLDSSAGKVVVTEAIDLSLNAGCDLAAKPDGSCEKLVATHSTGTAGENDTLTREELRERVLKELPALALQSTSSVIEVISPRTVTTQGTSQTTDVTIATRDNTMQAKPSLTIIFNAGNSCDHNDGSLAGSNAGGIGQDAEPIRLSDNNLPSLDVTRITNRQPGQFYRVQVIEQQSSLANEPPASAPLTENKLEKSNLSTEPGNQCPDQPAKSGQSSSVEAGCEEVTSTTDEATLPTEPLIWGYSLPEEILRKRAKPVEKPADDIPLNLPSFNNDNATVVKSPTKSLVLMKSKFKRAFNKSKMEAKTRKAQSDTSLLTNRNIDFKNENSPNKSNETIMFARKTVSSPKLSARATTASPLADKEATSDDFTKYDQSSRLADKGGQVKKRRMAARKTGRLAIECTDLHPLSSARVAEKPSITACPATADGVKSASRTLPTETTRVRSENRTPAKISVFESPTKDFQTIAMDFSKTAVIKSPASKGKARKSVVTDFSANNLTTGWSSVESARNFDPSLSAMKSMVSELSTNFSTTSARKSDPYLSTKRLQQGLKLAMRKAARKSASSASPKVPVHEGSASPKVPLSEGSASPKVPVSEASVSPKVPISEASVSPKVPVHEGSASAKVSVHEGSTSPKAPVSERSASPKAMVHEEPPSPKIPDNKESDVHKVPEGIYKLEPNYEQPDGPKASSPLLEGSCSPRAPVHEVSDQVIASITKITSETVMTSSTEAFEQTQVVDDQLAINATKITSETIMTSSTLAPDADNEPLCKESTPATDTEPMDNESAAAVSLANNVTTLPSLVTNKPCIDSRDSQLIKDNFNIPPSVPSNNADASVKNNLAGDKETDLGSATNLCKDTSVAASDKPRSITVIKGKDCPKEIPVMAARKSMLTARWSANAQAKRMWTMQAKKILFEKIKRSRADYAKKTLATTAPKSLDNQLTPKAQAENIVIPISCLNETEDTESCSDEFIETDTSAETCDIESSDPSDCDVQLLCERSFSPLVVDVGSNQIKAPIPDTDVSEQMSADSHKNEQPLVSPVTDSETKDYEIPPEQMDTLSLQLSSSSPIQSDSEDSHHLTQERSAKEWRDLFSDGAGTNWSADEWKRRKSLMSRVYSGSVKSLNPVEPLRKKLEDAEGCPVTHVNTPEGLTYRVMNDTPVDTFHDNEQCMCTLPGVARVRGKPAFCQAIDTVMDKIVNCAGRVGDVTLTRASIKTPYLALCKSHRKRFNYHRSCPTCGLFCTAGEFLECQPKSGHLYHACCQVRSVDNEPLCPHCGTVSQQVKIQLEQPKTTAKKKVEITTKCAKRSSELNDSEGKAKMCIKLTVQASTTVEEGGKEYVDRLYAVKSNSLLNKNKLVTVMGGLKHLEPLIKERMKSHNHTSLKSLVIFIEKNDISQLVLALCDFVRSYPREATLSEPANAVTGDSLLHIAVRSNALAAVHSLVVANAQVNRGNKEGVTPLMLAIEHDYQDIARYLVGAGALVEARDQDGMRPLHVAAKAKRVEMCEYLLLNCLADVNSVDDGGWTPLVWAIEHAHVEVVRILLDAGANIHICDNEQNAGIHWAAYSGNTDILHMLLERFADVESVNEHGDRPLHVAVRQGRTEAIVLLISKGADTSTINNEHETAADCCLWDEATKNFLQINQALRSCRLDGVQTRAPPLLLQDLSRGMERIPIPVTNTVDDETLPEDFHYVTEHVWSSPISINTMISSLTHCTCSNSCGRSSCVCSRSSITCWYTKDGLLCDQFDYTNPPNIYECNRMCKCWMNCTNRLIQRGITCQLELFKTQHRGWGVKTRHDIPKGCFVCEYVGELIPDDVAETREDDSYLFDLDNKDGETYCIDARFYGNISRFINHRCEPNLTPVRVFVDHQDVRFPRICFFAKEDIQAGAELGFDYGEKFWIVKYKHFRCDCQNEQCKYNDENIYQTLAHHNISFLQTETEEQEENNELESSEQHDVTEQE